MGTYNSDVQLENDDVPAARPTIARSNWLTTLVVGLVMLVTGMLAGYFGRPLVTPQVLSSTPVTSASAVNPSAGAPSSTTLMDAVVAQTRHFKGDPNAPVTIIEFGDFQ